MAVDDMDLAKAQNILWSFLTEQEKKTHIKVYELAMKDLSVGIAKTVIDYGKTEINTPAKLYFSRDESLNSQPNIVGQVLHDHDDNTIVVFESQDIKDLLEIYFGNNILN